MIHVNIDNLTKEEMMKLEIHDFAREPLVHGHTQLLICSLDNSIHILSVNPPDPLGNTRLVKNIGSVFATREFDMVDAVAPSPST